MNNNQTSFEDLFPNWNFEDDLNNIENNSDSTGIETSKDETDSINTISDVNNKVLLDTLSPEVSKNEITKRVHKYILIGVLFLFLIIQFVTVAIISYQIIQYGIQPEANIDILNSLLKYAGVYITSVIVELVAILKYIVQNVFDSSLSDLVKVFKETKNES